MTTLIFLWISLLVNLLTFAMWMITVNKVEKLEDINDALEDENGRLEEANESLAHRLVGVFDAMTQALLESCSDDSPREENGGYSENPTSTTQRSQDVDHDPEREEHS